MATATEINKDSATNTFARLDDNSWGIRSDFVHAVGSDVWVKRRDGSGIYKQVKAQVKSAYGWHYFSVVDDGSSNEDKTTVTPQPINGQPKVNRGDTLSKEVRGVVKTVNTETNEVTIRWEPSKRTETLALSDVEDATATETTGDVTVQELPSLTREHIANLEQEVKESRSQIAALQANVALAGIKEVHLKDKNGETVKVTTGLFHQKFDRILQLVKARKNIFLYGPTGCGKSHVCKQVAESLGMRFAFVSCTAGMSEGVLGGRLLPVGKSGTFEYVISEFVDCYENGGIFLLDEIDAADSNVLLLINAALANGHMAVPNRPKAPYANRHPDFVCVAAANTVGTGADRLYSGRNKLDAATLDRFGIGKIMMTYDERVEETLCPHEAVRKQLQQYRKMILDHRLERAMSTRFMIDAHDMITEGWGMKEIDEAFFEGWREDEVKKVKGGF